MGKKSKAAAKPLLDFDYGLVSSRLQGLFINIDRDLQRLVDQSASTNSEEAQRRFTLLNVMFRFALNSYETVLYFGGDAPEDRRRKPSYVIVAPSANRQLLDLLFSLAYMVDDFGPRSLAYQKSGWRELHEELHFFRGRFSGDVAWKEYLKQGKLVLDDMARRCHITPEEKKRPQAIPYWKTPYQLIQEQTPCREYLKYLEMWLYKDTSAQAHLAFGGLLRVAGFLVADLVGDDAKQLVKDRPLKAYRSQHLSRTAFIVLAVATEIDTLCNLGNHASIDYLWVILGAYLPEAKELYEIRYQNRPRVLGT